MSSRKGPPKHQNKFAWKLSAGRKINETEVGGKFRPYSEVAGVCPRCKEQIEWKRKYGEYKPLTEPAKCIIFVDKPVGTGFSYARTPKINNGFNGSGKFPWAGFVGNAGNGNDGFPQFKFST